MNLTQLKIEAKEIAQTKRDLDIWYAQITAEEKALHLKELMGTDVAAELRANFAERQEYMLVSEIFTRDLGSISSSAVCRLL